MNRIACLLAVLVAGLSAAGAWAAPRTVTFSGRVVDARGMPLSVTSNAVLPRLGFPLSAQMEIRPGSGREMRASFRFTTATGEVVQEIRGTGSRCRRRVWSS